MFEKSATPDHVLRAEILNSTYPKNEREHWAARHITKLEAKLAEARELLSVAYEPYECDMAFHEWHRRRDALLSEADLCPLDSTKVRWQMSDPQKYAAAAGGFIFFLFWLSGWNPLERGGWTAIIWATAAGFAWMAHEVKAGRL